MAQEVTNFARFYAVLGRMEFASGDLCEEIRRGFVRQFSLGRTDSLREMTSVEYKTLCSELERTVGISRQKYVDELRRSRSVCLRLMQKIGVDTTDWTRVNEFCRHPRIAGKPFARITLEELEHLALKLRSIQRKGGLNREKVR